MTSPRIIKALIANREGAAQRAEAEAGRQREAADKLRQALGRAEAEASSDDD